MFEIVRQLVLKKQPTKFEDFHAIVSKHMPDVTRHPEMYDRCFDLMKLAWEVSAKNNS